MWNPLQNIGTEADAQPLSHAFMPRHFATLDAEKMEKLLEVLRTKDLRISLGETPVTSISWLGSGGVKTVHDIKVHNKRYALTIPNAIRSVPELMETWECVLDEADKTTQLREMGFHTNGLSQIVRTTINGITIPCLLMQRYRDLPVEVRDNKNPVSSVGYRRILPPGVSLEAITDIVKPLAEDIANLLRHNVCVGPDSVNICVADGQPRLYFNDLGTAKFDPIPEHEQRAVINFYANAAIAALINGVIEEEYEEYKACFDEHHKTLSDTLYTETVSRLSVSPVSA